MRPSKIEDALVLDLCLNMTQRDVVRHPHGIEVHHLQSSVKFNCKKQDEGYPRKLKLQKGSNINTPRVFLNFPA